MEKIMTTNVETFNASEFFGTAYQALVDAGIDQQKNDIIRYPLVEERLLASVTWAWVIRSWAMSAWLKSMK